MPKEGARPLFSSAFGAGAVAGAKTLGFPGFLGRGTRQGVRALTSVPGWGVDRAHKEVIKVKGGHMGGP